MERTIQISKSLWLLVNDNLPPEYDDGLITIRDDVGGNTLIDKEEIPALIEALQTLI